MILLALTGLQAAGRGIVASRLVSHHGFIVHRFETPIRRMLSVGLGIDDATLDARDKSVPLDGYGGVTLRQMKRTLGQEWGRRMIHSDVWVTAWARSMPDAPRVVADDLGFFNEAHAVHNMGGEVWRIDRPSLTITDHPAHQVMRELPTDITVQNLTTISALVSAVDEAAEAMIARQ